MHDRTHLRVGVVFAGLYAALPALASAQQIAAAPEAVSVSAQAAAQPAVATPAAAPAAAQVPGTSTPAPAAEAAAPATSLAPAPAVAPPPPAAPAELPPPPPAAAAPRAAGPASTFDWSSQRGHAARKRNFYLRLNAGLLAQHASYAREPNAGGGAISVAAGGSVAREIVIFGELNVEGNDDVDGGSAAMLGAGVAYVLPEPGVYFSGAVGPSRGSYRVDNDTSTVTDRNENDKKRDSRDTAVGLGVSAFIGKEWQIEDGPFGLGIAAFGRYSALGSSNYRALGLTLSGTYY